MRHAENLRAWSQLCGRLSTRLWRSLVLGARWALRDYKCRCRDDEGGADRCRYQRGVHAQLRDEPERDEKGRNLKNEREEVPTEEGGDHVLMCKNCREPPPERTEALHKTSA